MNEPVHANCLAEVIGGVLGEKSPNLGLVVRVLKYVGDDPTYGRIWRCKGEYVESYAAVTGAEVKTPPRGDGTMDFAQTWLRKIPEPPIPAATKIVEEELTS